MNLNRGVARPSPAPTTATRSNVSAPATHSDAGVARGSGLFGPLTRAAAKDDVPSKKGDKDEGLSDDDQEVAKVKKAKDTIAISGKDKDPVNDVSPNPGQGQEDDSKVKKAKDSESLFDKNKPDTKPGQEDDPKDVKKAAGDGGDFKPMGGDAKNPWDANSDKGENPAPNSTGAPDTPSGL